MKKKVSERFKPLKKLAAHDEQKVAVQLGDARKTVMDCENRITQLKSFRKEYAMQMQRAGEAGMAGSRLREFQQFISQIDTAISQQQEKLTKAEHHCQHLSRQWQKKHRNTEIMDKTIQRMQKKEHGQEKKKAQREQDEHAARMFGRNSDKD